MTLITDTLVKLVRLTPEAQRLQEELDNAYGEIGFLRNKLETLQERCEELKVRLFSASNSGKAAARFDVSVEMVKAHSAKTCAFCCRHVERYGNKT